MEQRFALNVSTNPLWKLPITDPRCNNASCFDFVYGYLDDQLRYSNYNFPLYAQWTVIFYTTTVTLFFLLHLYRSFNDQSHRTRLRERVIACWRMVNYRRASGWIGSKIDVSYGQLILLSIATIFVAILPFFQGYFLRDLFRYGSPPLSVRCAMLISALLPMCLALAGKVNIISLLTGISYAKLNIWHRFVAYIIFALAVVHTIPHCIAPVKEGGWAELAILYRKGERELSGTVLLTSFALMVVASMPWVRNRFYEFFKIGHIVLAILFVVFLFWHIKGEQITPDYLYGSIAIMIANFVARTIYRNRVPLSLKEFVHGFPTELEVLPGNVTRVVIHCPQRLQWQPGQHCFITIPGITMMQAHPFTIASISWKHSRHGRNDVVLLIRALKGFTKNLAEHATNHKMSNQSVDRFTAIAEAQKLRISTRAWLDGPYGDVHPTIDRQYHGVICVAGGSGITASLPWLSYLACRMRTSSHSPLESCKTRSINLIWCIRSLHWIHWAEREICDALHDVMIANQQLDGLDNGKTEERMPERSSSSKGKIKVIIFVTSRNVDETQMSVAGLDLLLAAGVDADDTHVQVEVIGGRPSYSALLPDMIDKKRNIVLACGPQGQKIDLANSVAQLQRMVLRNETKEIALHTETFGW
ncbi:hypothetical protein EJ08DRAFT_322025 [Tothia fuscella]|uniref:ferric-chelate reductase (NADPH) n=1 Tax=Tothia fuscella TaxID=1048955 RepID=A0A9P4TX95_9PEZI|nr:hypothetical protein EJ08DRAFT_322025 [Tothia fuscella]